MNKLLCVVSVSVLSIGLMGCPLMGSSGKLIGQWEWVEASRLVDPTTLDDHDSPAVAQNFANNGRLRKTLVFEKETNAFLYREEAFLPDRQAALRQDKGVGVNWRWVETYIAKGTFETERFPDANRELAIPGLDTELNVVVSEHTETFAIFKRDTDGNLVRDTQIPPRIMLEYIASTSSASAENPLVLRALMGLNPFDELMVSWAQFSVGKSLDYNHSHERNVETYLRIASE